MRSFFCSVVLLLGVLAAIAEFAVGFLPGSSCCTFIEKRQLYAQTVESGPIDDIDRIWQKHHTLSICVVPPSSRKDIWNALTQARTKLRDPGLFRWPPHVNLLYPFVTVRTSTNDTTLDPEILSKVENATRQVSQFNISLNRLGTFGNPTRGVLWLYPQTFREKEHLSIYTEEEPLFELQSLLEEEFPICSESLKQRGFIPHMTLSHFTSLEDAQRAQETLKWTTNQSFLCSEIYLLERQGDEGQFQRIATFPLGVTSNEVTLLHHPPVFPGMPLVEDDWIREERIKLKNRRNNRPGERRRGPRQRGRRRRSTAKMRRDGRAGGIWQSKDSAEVIAQKRAERKARQTREPP